MGGRDGCEVEFIKTGDNLNVGVGRWRKLETPRFLAQGTDWDIELSKEMAGP